MTEKTERRPVWLPLLCYAVLVTLLALTHDMWRDEVRAFSVAKRAASWSQMLLDLHEEGHPALWYVVLRAGYAITHSQLVLPVAAALIGVAAAYVVLRFAPFSYPVRLLTVFGVFLAHELSVVARSYGLGVLLMLLSCVWFSQRRERPWLFALGLGLMANTSVHGAAASLVLFFVWLLDLFDEKNRRSMLRPWPVICLALVVVAVAFALLTATPPGDMVFAVSASRFTPAGIARVIFVDPGFGLKGLDDASIIAAGQAPWWRIGVDVAIVSRILVDVAVLSVAWSLRRSKGALAAFVLAIAGFEVLFGLVYPAGLRHEAVLAFLIVALAWIAIVREAEPEREVARRRVSFGLIPLLAVQAVVLPFTVWRQVMKPESMARELAEEIRETPRFAKATLMSEPEPMMETVLYYAGNPVFMPRQRELDYRAYFDAGAKRQMDMSIGQLAAVADSVACATQQPVLLSIGHRRFFFDESGTATGPMRSIFRWNAEERKAFEARARPLRWFRGATSDENYRTYDVSCQSQVASRKSRVPSHK